MTDPDQARAALAQANRRRLAQADLRAWVRGTRDMRTSQHRLAQVIITRPAAVGHRTVFDLLLWGYRIGEHAALTWLNEAGMSPYLRLEDATLRQRTVLARLLESNRRHPPGGGLL